MSHPHITPEQLQNGLHFQDEMLRLGFDKMRAEVLQKEDGSGIRLNVDISKSIEHFEYVHAMIANTATQKAIREELDVQGKIFESLVFVHDSAHKARCIIADRILHLTKCLAELDAQFTDLADKIFGTDKP